MDVLISDICKKAVKKWGQPFQEDMALEEMSELAKAILKSRRSHSIEEYKDRIMDIIEEIVDVEFMIEQLKYMFVGEYNLDKEYNDILNSKIDYIISLLERGKK